MFRVTFNKEASSFGMLKSMFIRLPKYILPYILIFSAPIVLGYIKGYPPVEQE